MVKNVQIKIILIFTIITTVLITGLSIYFLLNLQNINIKLTTQPIQEVIDYTNTFIANGKILTIYAIFAFLLIAIVIAIFITKKVTKPINKLISYFSLYFSNNSHYSPKPINHSQHPTAQYPIQNHRPCNCEDFAAYSKNLPFRLILNRR